MAPRSTERICCRSAKTCKVENNDQGRIVLANESPDYGRFDVVFEPTSSVQRKKISSEEPDFRRRCPGTTRTVIQAEIRVENTSAISTRRSGAAVHAFLAIISAERSARAAIVIDGLRPIDVGKMEPSATNRFGYPNTSPRWSTTPSSAVRPMRQPPRG